MRYLLTFESFHIRDNNKAVSTNGIPLIVYRADHFERTDFYSTAYGSEPGIYFTTDKKYAETYGWFITVANVILKNPLIVSNINDITDWNFDSIELKDFGYDGLMYTDKETGESIVYTFYDEQVHVLKQYSLHD
jgi:hypothetical protein